LYGTPKVVYTGVAKTLIVWVRLRGKNSLFVKLVCPPGAGYCGRNGLNHELHQRSSASSSINRRHFHLPRLLLKSSLTVGGSDASEQTFYSLGLGMYDFRLCLKGSGIVLESCISILGITVNETQAQQLLLK